MVTAAVVLTVANGLKRSGAFRPGVVRTLSRFFAASLANRHSSVLWVPPTVFICAGMWSCHAAGGFTLTATLITSGYAIILTDMGIAWSSILERPLFVSGYPTKDATVA